MHHSVQDVILGRLCGLGVEAGSTWELSVLSAQLCCEPITALKINVTVYEPVKLFK